MAGVEGMYILPDTNPVNNQPYALSAYFASGKGAIQCKAGVAVGSGAVKATIRNNQVVADLIFSQICRKDTVRLTLLT